MDMLGIRECEKEEVDVEVAILRIVSRSSKFIQKKPVTYP
jgi:hypothetical protein